MFELVALNLAAGRPGNRPFGDDHQIGHAEIELLDRRGPQAGGHLLHVFIADAADFRARDLGHQDNVLAFVDLDLDGSGSGLTAGMGDFRPDLFDVARRVIASAQDDEVLDPADDVEAFGPGEGQVARAQVGTFSGGQPGCEGLLGQFRILVVARGDVRAFEPDFAGCLF